jgi:signal transduction histidine kinase
MNGWGRGKGTAAFGALRKNGGNGKQGPTSWRAGTPGRMASEAMLTRFITKKHLKTWTAILLSSMTRESWSLMIVIWVGAVFALIYLRNAAIAEAETDINNLTRVIAAESEVVFRSAEAILLDTRQTIEESDSFEQAKVERLLNSKQARVPFLRSILIVDADGHLRYLTNLPNPGPAFVVTNREWFSMTRDTPTRALMVSPPVESRITPGNWIIPLSLRLEGPNHSFRGAILGSLDPAFFRTLFRELDLGADSAITLQRRDSVVLSRQPDDEKTLGKTLADGAIFQMMQTKRSGVTRARSVVNGDARVLGGRMLDSFPVYVAITRTEASILKVWHAQMIIIVMTTSALSLLLLVVMRQSDTAARLEAKSEAVQALVDASPRPLAILRRTSGGDVVVEWANSFFAELFDRPLPNILDKPLRPLLASISSTPLPNCIDDPKGLRFEIIINTLKGPTETQLLFTPVKGKNNPFGTILVTALDLTAKRTAVRRDAERHLFEALGRLAGRIAHEINNVLQPILSHASLALHASKANDDATLHLREIQNGVRAGREIVRSVLTVAGGKTVPRDLRPLEQELTAALGLIRPSVPERVALDVDLHAADAMVGLASGEIFQILSNLVGNAVDAIEGTGAIHIEVTPCDIALIESAVLGLSPGSYAQMLVTDTGSGMKREVALRALDPFFTTKPFGKGVGLGLSTVQSVVDGLKGSITLSSTPGNGTSVRILFPSVTPPC